MASGKRRMLVGLPLKTTELDAEFQKLTDGVFIWTFDRITKVNGFEVSGGPGGGQCTSLMVGALELLVGGPVPVAQLHHPLELPALEPGCVLRLEIVGAARHNRKIRPVGRQVL